MSEEKNGKEVVETLEKMEIVDVSMGGAGGVVDKGLTREGMDSVLFLADHIDELAAAHERITLACLKRAQPGDWVVHGDEGREKASIGYAGAFRSASLAGISFINWTARRVTWTDDAGPAYRYEYECDAMLGKRVLRAFGRFGSRDKFLGYVGEKKDSTGKVIREAGWKDLEDINEGDVKIAAMHRCYAEGVKALLGFHAMDPNYLKKHGVELQYATRVRYGEAAVSGKVGKPADGEAKKDAPKPADGQKTTTGKVAQITKKDGTGAKGPWTKYSITLAGDSKPHGTFDTAIVDAVVELRAEGKEVILSYTEDTYGRTITGVAEDKVATAK